MLERSYAVLKNKHGEDYEPESLKVTIASLDRHLKNKEYSLSIVRDREFSSSKQVLEGKAKQLPFAGHGKRRNKARQVSEEEEEILWKSEELGGKTPESLIHTMWGPRQLQPKMFQNGGERCPVALFGLLKKKIFWTSQSCKVVSNRSLTHQKQET